MVLLTLLGTIQSKKNLIFTYIMGAVETAKGNLGVKEKHRIEIGRELAITHYHGHTRCLNLRPAFHLGEDKKICRSSSLLLELQCIFPKFVEVRSAG